MTLACAKCKLRPSSLSVKLMHEVTMDSIRIIQCGWTKLLHYQCHWRTELLRQMVLEKQTERKKSSKFMFNGY